MAGQFAAATMHEVNGPLKAISNLNYLLQTNPDDGEQVRKYSGLCTVIENSRVDVMQDRFLERAEVYKIEAGVR